MVFEHIEFILLIELITDVNDSMDNILVFISKCLKVFSTIASNLNQNFRNYLLEERAIVKIP